MKFQVRDGFVCRLTNQVNIGNGQLELQESLAYAGQSLDLTAAQAEAHAHQLEPVCDEAKAWHDSKVLVVADSAPLGLSPQQLQSITEQIARQLLGALPAAATPAAPGS